MSTHIAVELIGHTADNGQQHQMKQHTQQSVLNAQRSKNHDGQEDRHDDDHKQETGTASGMVARLGADIFHRQL